MKHLGLFAGIGGFEISAQWAGFETVAMCEIDPFCQKVLKYHFPNAILHEDIRATDFTIYRGQIDVLTGGPPCQPASIAGQRKGTNDDRWLWPEAIRALREIKPTYAIFENPTGILTLENGIIFAGILTEVGNEGYEIEIFNLPAAGIEAPHDRQRIWIVAYRTDAGNKNMQQRRKNGIYENGIITDPDVKPLERRDNTGRSETSKRHVSSCNTFNDLASTKHKIQTGRNLLDSKITSNPNVIRQSGKEYREVESGRTSKNGIRNHWQNFPTQSPVCSGNYGFPGQLADITFSKWKNESIKALGNAIVPQVAYELFKAINIIEYERL